MVLRRLSKVITIVCEVVLGMIFGGYVGDHFFRLLIVLNFVMDLPNQTNFASIP